MKSFKIVGIFGDRNIEILKINGAYEREKFVIINLPFDTH